VSRRAFRGALVAFVLTGLALAASAYWAYRYAMRFPDRPAGGSGRTISVEIPSGANFPIVVSLLESKGLVSSAAAFRIYANYKGLASKVRAGSYRFASDISARDLLQILVHGVPAPTVTVLIPEGKNMLEVADLLAAGSIAPREQILKAMRDKTLLRRLGVPADSIEGYLYPDTYKLRAGTPAAEVLEKLHGRHKAVYYSLCAQHKAGLKALRQKLRWDHHEIVTMASIVEKETGQKFERPRIAGVFLNRLTSPSFFPKVLQTDPTILYGCTVPPDRSTACRELKDRIRRAQLDDRENPYNTYTHVGLPPGPISNPGRAAIEAVLAPEKSKYLYFVSKNDGTHQFSATKAEHEAAVDRYQRHKSN
jgi:UPF0755 protein